MGIRESIKELGVKLGGEYEETCNELLKGNSIEELKMLCESLLSSENADIWDIGNLFITSMDADSVLKAMHSVVEEDSKNSEDVGLDPKEIRAQVFSIFLNSEDSKARDLLLKKVLSKVHVVDSESEGLCIVLKTDPNEKPIGYTNEYAPSYNPFCEDGGKSKEEVNELIAAIQKHPEIGIWLLTRVHGLIPKSMQDDMNKARAIINYVELQL